MRIGGFRINLLWLGAALAVILVGIYFFAGRNGPTAVATEFMDALGRGDSAKLTDLSLIRNGDREAMLKQWEFATQQAGKSYSFAWRIKESTETQEDMAAVKLSVIRNVRQPTSYEENFELSLVRQNGKWLVDVAAISFLMYPALPGHATSPSA